MTPICVTDTVNSFQEPSRHMRHSYLVLLCSHPDTVRRHALRKTRRSTSLISGCHTGQSPADHTAFRSISFRMINCQLSRVIIPNLKSLLTVSLYSQSNEVCHNQLCNCTLSALGNRTYANIDVHPEMQILLHSEEYI